MYYMLCCCKILSPFPILTKPVNMIEYFCSLYFCKNITIPEVTIQWKTLKKRYYLKKTPIPAAVAKLSIPMVFSSLVMVLYNMADTYFVGMLNNSVENAAVSLSSPVLLAFNAIQQSVRRGNLQYDEPCPGQEGLRYCVPQLCLWLLLLPCVRGPVRAFSALCSGVPFSLLSEPIRLPGQPPRAISSGQFVLGSAPAILNVVMAYLVRSEGAAMHASIGTMSGCLPEYYPGSYFHPSLGLPYGSPRSRPCHLSF